MKLLAALLIAVICFLPAGWAGYPGAARRWLGGSSTGDVSNAVLDIVGMMIALVVLTVWCGVLAARHRENRDQESS